MFVDRLAGGELGDPGCLVGMGEPSPIKRREGFRQFTS